MSHSNRVDRRKFLKSSTAAALAAGVWSEIPAAASNSPNEKLQIGCIGVANRASANIEGVRGEAIVALCDVDRNYLDRAREQLPDAQIFSDYRELISYAGDRLDAVVVSTPDQHHAPATIRAIRAGLHVYCEKPLTHTVHEARVVAEAARKHGVVTQLGTQIHAGDNYRRVAEHIQAGTIGDVREVHVWVGKGWGGGERPQDSELPPKSLCWDLWLGPAQPRPFAPGRYHPAQWRRWWEFGGGTIGDMACHYVDLPFWALKLRHPISCEAIGPECHEETCPNGLTVKYDFPAREDLPPVQLTWYDGDHIPKEVAGERVPGNGVLFVGSAGKLFSDYSKHRFFPTDKFADVPAPEQAIPNSIGHHAEWIKACKDGSTTTCNFDYSGALTEAVLLGNVAYRSGQNLDWDAENLTATNCPDASRFIRKQYRHGWEVA